MRKLQKPPAEELRKKKQEPIAEGLQVVVPTDTKGRVWRKMSDEEVIGYAKGVIRNKGMSKRAELQKADPGLYTVLRNRKLLDNVGFVQKRREERSWKDMKDGQIIKLAKKVMEKNGITGREELSNTDPGLYQALRKRGLLFDIEFDEKERSWKDMSNERIIGFAKRLMKEKKATTPKDLKKIDSRLLDTIYRRGLRDKVGFKGRGGKTRAWSRIDDDEILGLAKRLVEEKGMVWKEELRKADSGLYMILWKRGLLDEVGIEEKQRPWRKMSDEEIICHTRKVMKENAITRRNELKDFDSGLYSILMRRKLINRTFLHTDQQQKDKARDAVIDALEAFGAANDNDSAEDEVA
ncbi:hypothetical protein KKE92_06195 [Candidatus Micrarchaeota archaeon]|nr:hypothetical protein [Candidatus Micrarchaeota archaeon]MBU1682198.1 hypothetical protein [Candidatus Micrarchaeota archaeon]